MCYLNSVVQYKFLGKSFCRFTNLYMSYTELCLWIYIYIYIERERERETHTHRAILNYVELNIIVKLVLFKIKKIVYVILLSYKINLIGPTSSKDQDTWLVSNMMDSSFIRMLHTNYVIIIINKGYPLRLLNLLKNIIQLIKKKWLIFGI